MNLFKGTMTLLLTATLLAGCTNDKGATDVPENINKQVESMNKAPIKVIDLDEKDKELWGTLKNGVYTTKNGAYKLNIANLQKELFKKADASEWLTNVETALLVESTIYKQFKDGVTCKMHRNEGINFSSEEQAEKLTPLFTKEVLFKPVSPKEMNESQRQAQEKVFDIFNKDEVIRLNPKLSKYKDECYFVYYFEDLDIYVVNFNTRDYIVYNRIGAPIGRAENTNFWLTDRRKEGEVGKGIVKGKAEFSQFGKVAALNPSRTSESVGEVENYLVEDCGCD